MVHELVIYMEKKKDAFNIGRQFALRSIFGDLQMAFAQSKFALHSLRLYTNVRRILHFPPKHLIRPFYCFYPLKHSFALTC